MPTPSNRPLKQTLERLGADLLMARLSINPEHPTHQILTNALETLRDLATELQDE